MLVFLRAAGFTKHEAAVSVNIERPGLRFIPAGGGLEDGWVLGSCWHREVQEH